MGKKDKKDKEKVEAKKARQAAKQQKVTSKRSKKEAKEIGEADIESIIAEFQAKEKLRTAVVITACDQPSPRSNFSLTALSTGEMLLFGGEYSDGESTSVYNELYRWNVEKNEWKRIESLNTPPPRCAHQAVAFKDKVYVFGGEYATLDQFYHYRDLWMLDTKTNVWTELTASTTGPAPTARSGHRMVLWRNYIVLFGGFYEALREVRWFNDLYLFSLQEQKWYQVTGRLFDQVPRPRSGFLMVTHPSEDTIFLYGGYSREKSAAATAHSTGASKASVTIAEGRVMTDMWTLNLRGVVNNNRLDTSKAVWTKIPRKGDAPSPRVGGAMVTFKNKAIFYGGVTDSEGLNHRMCSVFHSDLYAFDLDRRRWFQLGLKAPKKDKTRRKKVAADAEESSESESDDEVTEETVIDTNSFGYIDEAGNVVYIALTDEDMQTAASEPVNDGIVEQATTALSELDMYDVNNAPTQASSAAEVESKLESKSSALEPTPKPHVSIFDQMISSNTAPEERNSGSSDESDGEEDADETADKDIIVTPLSRYFSPTDTAPRGRMRPGMLVRGSRLYIYGGVTEFDDVEVMLDDCWSLDLNKRDVWKKILGGTMHTMVWKSEGGGDTASEMTGGMDSDVDSEHEADKTISSAPATTVATQHVNKAGVRAEVEALRSRLASMTATGDVTAGAVPLQGESLREFAKRTVDVWAAAARADYKEGDEIMSDKDIKRKGFALAEIRYNETKPLVDELSELALQMEDNRKSKDDKKKKSSSRSNR